MLASFDSAAGLQDRPCTILMFSTILLKVEIRSTRIPNAHRYSAHAENGLDLHINEVVKELTKFADVHFAWPEFPPKQVKDKSIMKKSIPESQKTSLRYRDPVTLGPIALSRLSRVMSANSPSDSNIAPLTTPPTGGHEAPGPFKVRSS
jgi:hypothetical protein